MLARSRVATALLAAGYAVFSPSYRRHALMAEEIDDAATAYEYLRNHPQFDPDRLAILGNSHGGTIALNLAPRTSARAVIEYSAVSDIELMVAFMTSNRVRASMPLVREALDDLKRTCGGTCEEVPEMYRGLSPAYRIWGIPCPVFIAHGSHDGLVPVTHAYVLRDALEAAEKNHEIHIFPRATHAFPFQKRTDAGILSKLTIDFLVRNGCSPR